MKKIIALLFTALALSAFTFKFSSKLKPHVEENFCLTAEDYKLYQLINIYRKSLKLDSIPLSKSLSLVAITHTLDLKLNHPNTGNCNLHSWSKNGKWEACCYKGGNDGACMWKKPSEISNYPFDGFEIAAFSSGKLTAAAALELWKGSPGHHAVIANSGQWKAMPWNAMGVSVYGNYAVVWFGIGKDVEGSPKICK